MIKKILLLGLGSLFLLLLNLAFRSYNEQSSTADVPSISQSSEETVGNEQLVVGESNGELDITSKELPEEAASLFTFSSNPSSSYYDLNPDYVGWVDIENTAVDYPVVRGQDNEFYLEHDFYKEEHILGSIFMDYRNIGMGLDDHTILYGHYTQSGLMFADLEKYLSEEFVADNPTFTFRDPYTERTYQLFSVHISPADSTYIRTSFKDKDLESYYEELNEASAFPIASEFKPGQKLFTLISCNYTVDDGRIYIHAYEVTD